ncbi:MAG TPA: hypothetical protein VK752_18730 [Bryobacteraceae bacterium]|jgi:hypothetical protein|nr:hypothetical protein [Bryobacteraceae bacterium]
MLISKTGEGICEKTFDRGIVHRTGHRTKKKAPAPPPESPEHEFARVRLETHIKEELLVCYGPCVSESQWAASIVRQLLTTGYDIQGLFRERAAKLDGDTDRKAEWVARERQAFDLLFTLLTSADKCATVYRQTIDKKASDLTVRETQQIDACRTLRLYPPPTE